MKESPILGEEVGLIVSKAEFYLPAAPLNRTSIIDETSFLKTFWFFQSTILTTTKRVEKKGKK